MKPTLAVALAVALSIFIAACGGDSDSTTSGSTESPPSGPTATNETPIKESPRSRPAPGFHQTGKLQIPVFGVEASDGQRKQAEAALEGYLQAREDGEWAKACTYLLAPTRTELLASAERLNRGTGKSCATALELAFTEYSKSRENLADDGVASLRVKPGAGAGFALFHGSDGADYWAAMKVEGGRWKVLTTNPTDLTASQ